MSKVEDFLTQEEELEIVAETKKNAFLHIFFCNLSKCQDFKNEKKNHENLEDLATYSEMDMVLSFHNTKCRPFFCIFPNIF